MLENITLIDASTIESGVFAFTDGVAWEQNRWLKEIKAPKATKIKASAFRYCQALVNVDFVSVGIGFIALTSQGHKPFGKNAIERDAVEMDIVNDSSYLRVSGFEPTSLRSGGGTHRMKPAVAVRRCGISGRR